MREVRGERRVLEDHPDEEALRLEAHSKKRLTAWKPRVFRKVRTVQLSSPEAVGNVE